MKSNNAWKKVEGMLFDINHLDPYSYMTIRYVVVSLVTRASTRVNFSGARGPVKNIRDMSNAPAAAHAHGEVLSREEKVYVCTD
jgi:hypothetical protein